MAGRVGAPTFSELAESDPDMAIVVMRAWRLTDGDEWETAFDSKQREIMQRYHAARPDLSPHLRRARE